MAVILNASTSTGYVQTADTSGDLVIQSNGTTQFNVTSTGAYGQLKSATAVNSTSGTSIEFTSIPSWVKRITVMFNGVSTNGTGGLQIQLGDSGGIETTGYIGSSGTQANSGSFAINGGSGTAATTYSGIITLANLSGNPWSEFGILGRADGVGTLISGGAKTLSDVLTQLRVIGSATSSPSDTFDAGSINILYEG